MADIGSDFYAGATAMRDAIVAWHTRAGTTFAETARLLERDGARTMDVIRANWASASHHSHAAFIARMKVPDA